ncbi:MAG: hypothetical protein GY832_00855 [Chloroflexi bacterium]|nr:hypothetical protein [Chloroflexota bacterium]
MAQDDEDRLTVASGDPLRPRDAPDEAPPLGVVEQHPHAGSTSGLAAFIPTSVPAPPSNTASFLSDHRVQLLGDKTKEMAATHLGGRYLPSADREAFAKAHKLVSDPLTRCPELDETMRDYAKLLNSSIDLRNDDILRDVGRRVADVWHPLLALHEVAERHLDEDKSLAPQTVMNFVAYMAKYVAAATQKVSFYRRHAIISNLDAAVKKQSSTSGSVRFGFRQSPFKKGSMSSGTRALLEKTPTDSSAFATSRLGTDMPLLFGGKLIDQLVSKSEDTTKTQKGLDHLFSARYGQSALRNAKRGGPSTTSASASKRGRFDNSRGSFPSSSGYYRSGEGYRRPPYSSRFSHNYRDGGRREPYRGTSTNYQNRNDRNQPSRDPKQPQAK